MISIFVQQKGDKYMDAVYSVSVALFLAVSIWDNFKSRKSS